MSPLNRAALPDEFVEKARQLDAQDPLHQFGEHFVHNPEVLAYLDGNSLGRPLRVTGDRMRDFIDDQWGTRLIRSWDERWIAMPTEVGDRLGRVALGAAAGQTIVADSTTVLLHKALHAAVSARPGRTEIIADTENFPTDRFAVAAVAKALGLTVRWISPDPATGVRPSQVEELLSENTAAVLLAHIAYKSAYIADMAAITESVHRAGALTVWDLCHSVGSYEVSLDACAVDLAVGCTYKYLNGGPGAPAFLYAASELQPLLNQPLSGWFGDAQPFAMASTHQPAPGIRRFLSGTPPILAMLPLQDMIAEVEAAGIAAIRQKSVQLTEFVIEIADHVLAEHGVTVASPRDPDVRGGHVTLEHPSMKEIVAELWQRGIIPDFRNPGGLRAGMSPLSTSFAEVALALGHVRELVANRRARGR